MIKKILSLFLLFVLCLIGTTVFADEVISLQVGSSVMTVNGVDKEIDSGKETAPVIINNRTFLPVRSIIEEIGGDVSWNENAKEITLSYNSNTIILNIDNTTAYLNNQSHTLDSAPVIINNRVFLPIRFIAESFDFDVEWNEADNKIIITKSDIVLNQVTDKAEEETENGNDVLIVYFSRTGTTKKLAENIHNITNGDIVEITPVEVYPEDYDECIKVAQDEINRDTRPEINIDIDDIEKYNTIIVGYPIWWDSVPPVVRTFFDSYDLSEKTIIPFCTHGGSGILGSMSKVKELCPNSDVKEGLDKSSQSDIENWLKENGFSK